MPMVADEFTLQDVADTLQTLGVGSVPAYMANINVVEHAEAYIEVVSILGARGWTLAQILASDMGPYWERKLTVYKVLSRPTRLAKVTNELLASLDVRPQLATAQLTTAGAAVDPLGDTGQASGGTIRGEHLPRRRGFDGWPDWEGP